MKQKVTTTSIDDFEQDNLNFNKGTTKGKKLMQKSLLEFGAGRSILVDKNNRIISGNKTQERAKEAGITKVIVVDADRDELVAVRRKDVDLDSKEGRRMALADNATSAANLAWDDSTLERAAIEYDIQADEWLESCRKGLDDTYSRKIETPVYEPSGTCPDLEDCYDLSKANELLARVKMADIPEKIKEFLRFAACRHVEFNYGKIADYYCHAPREVQELFEDSALVVIDFNKAIEGGFVKMTDELLEEYSKEYDGD